MTMVFDDLYLLNNKIQEYSWGSKTFLSGLLGKKNVDIPRAELWMGAHEKASSIIKHNEHSLTLDRAIAKAPYHFLGNNFCQNFSPQMPFLFKVLAADKPLSLQTHPNLEQAKRGFNHENNKNIPLTAFNRNYRDDNHKPELICALTPFWGLFGFRPVKQILEILESFSLVDIAGILQNNDSSQAKLKNFLKLLLKQPKSWQQKMVTTALTSKNSKKYPVEKEWLERLHQQYAYDIGVLGVLFLNLIKLEPGQALEVSAGQLHSYLLGAGIELMSSSDNVLRGGLTSKHIDIQELLAILNFDDTQAEILHPDSTGIYPTKAKEFYLEVIDINKNTNYQQMKNHSIEIIICMEGTAQIIAKKSISLEKGKSVVITAAAKNYEIKGQAKLFKAGVPGISEH